MWVSELEFNNIRSFAASGAIKLSKNINILLGANNAGKSTIIRVLYLLQQNRFGLEDIRIGQNVTGGLMQLEEVDNLHFQQYTSPSGSLTLEIFANRSDNSPIRLRGQYGANPPNDIPLVPSVEPQNFIYPYLSKRKVQGYNQQVNIQFEREVGDTLINLVAKVDRLANTDHPNHEEYEQACVDIFGFPITAFPANNGKQAGIIVDRYNNIPLESMGEGVPSLLGLIVNLCMCQ